MKYSFYMVVQLVQAVCGKSGFIIAFDSWDFQTNSGVETSPGTKTFKFGDSADVKWIKNVIISAKMGKTSYQNGIEVADTGIPLLLSKTSLKREGTVFDLVNDKAEIFE